MVNVAIVGCGRIADMHIPGYHNLPNAKIIAVCDTNKELAEKRAGQWGATKVYTDYEKLLSDTEIHAVEILTPQKLHEPMVLSAIKAGKHIALQKPMTINLKSAHRIKKAVSTSGKIFRVTDNYIFYPPYVKLKELISNGELGEITNLRIKFISGSSGGWEVPASSWEWRMKEREEGRGMQTFDHGHHLWATAIWLLGQPEKVVAWIDSLDEVIDSPAVMMWKYRDKKCYGSCEYVHAQELRIPSQYYANDEWLEVSGSKGIALVRRCTGDIDQGPALSVFTSGGWQDYNSINSDWIEGFKGATRNFIEAIEGKAEPALTIGDAYNILRFSLAMQKSAQMKREVWVSEMDAIFPAIKRYSLIRASRQAESQKKESFLSRIFGNTSAYADQAPALTEAFVEKFDPERTGDWNAQIGLRLLPDGGTPGYQFSLKIQDKRATLEMGSLPQTASLIITMPAGTWAAILLKKKRIETAFLQGKLKLEGKAEEALKLRSAFGI